MSDTAIFFSALYVAIGVWFVVATPSRGIIPDILFGVLWLFYAIWDGYVAIRNAMRGR